MDVKILELSEKEARFILTGATPAFANGLRRSILSEVPTLAIEYVNIYENTSVLFDEQLALRLGLIPLTTPEVDLYLPEECICNGEGCGQCQISFHLSVEGPNTVYARDLISTEPTVQIVEPTVPLVELKEGQRVYLEAIAILGRGTEHSKWQGAVATGYKYLPIINIGECDGCGHCIEECPRGVLQLNNGKITVKDPLECNLCGLCEDACELNGINISEDDEAFVFYIESDGSIPARELVLRGATEIEKKTETLQNQIKDLE